MTVTYLESDLRYSELDGKDEHLIPKYLEDGSINPAWESAPYVRMEIVSGFSMSIKELCKKVIDTENIPE